LLPDRWAPGAARFSARGIIVARDSRASLIGRWRRELYLTLLVTPPSPERIRVLRAIARLNVGGPAWNAVLLTAGTRARYPTVLAVGATGPHEADMSGLAEEHGVRLLRIPGLGRQVHLADDLRALWSLWRLCRRIRPEIVHTHTAKAGTLGRLAAWLAGVPVRVHTFHGHVFRGYFGRWQTAIYIAIERLLARITTRIVAISPRQEDDLRNYLRLDKRQVSVIPLGFDLSRFLNADVEAARRRFREGLQAGERIVVTMVGRLTAIKNHALAVRSLAAVASTTPNLLLVLVGGGEEEPALRALAQELGVSDRVRFAGWWDDLEAVYYGSDVVALSSNNEGTPVCLIEALACGRPVIATDVGGVADVLGEGAFGIMVPAGEEAAFAAALRRMLDPGERARLEGRGRASVLSRYDVARLVTDVEALYDELLEERITRMRGRRGALGRNRSRVSSAQTS